MRGAVVLLLLLFASCASPAPQRHDMLLEARVQSRDSAGFFLQPDGAFVELSPAGLARFRFTHERDEGEAAIIFDETRHVRLKLDPASRTIGEETPEGWRARYAMSDAVTGSAPAPSGEVTRYWIEGGGAFIRDGDHWIELSKEDGFTHVAPLRETRRDAARIELSDGARVVVIEPNQNRVNVIIGDRSWFLRLRAVD